MSNNKNSRQNARKELGKVVDKFTFEVKKLTYKAILNANINQKNVDSVNESVAQAFFCCYEI